MPTVLRFLLLALALTALPVAAGLVWSGASEEEPPAPEPPAWTSTPLASYDTSTVVVGRAGFCERIPEEAVTEALGRASRDEESYGTGERAAVGGVEDVAHEYGCRFEGRRGAEAHAWVFAPPVTDGRARDLVTEATGTGGCERAAQAPAYGDPSVALVCDDGERRSVSFRGLFGDAWLACSVAVPGRSDEAAALDRAGRWCVAVAEAASVTPPA